MSVERIFDPDRAVQQLQVIAETFTIAATIGAPIWLRGGWAKDFYLGEVTRDHQDIDWFAWAADASRLDDALRHHGYQPLAGHQLSSNSITTRHLWTTASRCGADPA